MQVMPSLLIPFSPYQSSPSLASSEASYQSSDDGILSSTMGGNPNSDVLVDGIGVLNYQRAIDIARNTEGDLDPTVSAYLDGAVQDIWTRISLQPESYIMTKDEFAVFNFYRFRYVDNDVAELAVRRYWDNTYENTTTSA